MWKYGGQYRYCHTEGATRCGNIRISTALCLRKSRPGNYTSRVGCPCQFVRMELTEDTIGKLVWVLVFRWFILWAVPLICFRMAVWKWLAGICWKFSGLSCDKLTWDVEPKIEERTDTVDVSFQQFVVHWGSRRITKRNNTLFCWRCFLENFFVPGGVFQGRTPSFSRTLRKTALCSLQETYPAFHGVEFVQLSSLHTTGTKFILDGVAISHIFTKSGLASFSVGFTQNGGLAIHCLSASGSISLREMNWRDSLGWFTSGKTIHFLRSRMLP